MGFAAGRAARAAPTHAHADDRRLGRLDDVVDARLADRVADLQRDERPDGQRLGDPDERAVAASTEPSVDLNTRGPRRRPRSGPRPSYPRGAVYQGARKTGSTACSRRTACSRDHAALATPACERPRTPHARAPPRHRGDVRERRARARLAGRPSRRSRHAALAPRLPRERPPSSRSIQDDHARPDAPRARPSVRSSSYAPLAACACGIAIAGMTGAARPRAPPDDDWRGRAHAARTAAGRAPQRRRAATAAPRGDRRHGGRGQRHGRRKHGRHDGRGGTTARQRDGRRRRDGRRQRDGHRQRDRRRRHGGRPAARRALTARPGRAAAAPTWLAVARCACDGGVTAATRRCVSSTTSAARTVAAATAPASAAARRPRPAARGRSARRASASRRRARAASASTTSTAARTPACINGVCHARCAGDAPCGAADRCVDAVCQPDLGPRPECRASAECATGRAVRERRLPHPLCRATSTAARARRARIAAAGVCVTAHEAAPQCQVAAECGLSQSCIDGACGGSTGARLFRARAVA